MKENVRKQGILLPVSSIPSVYGGEKCIRRRLLYGMGRGYPSQN